MARLIPSLLPRTAFDAGAYAELALLHTLERGLSGDVSDPIVFERPEAV